MNPELVVIGYTNIDVNVTDKSTSVLPGGAAYFVSLAASRMLKPVGLVTRIGKDFDTTFLFQHVSDKGVNIIPDKPTARSTQTYHSTSDLTDRTITLDWGVAPDLNPNDIPDGWLQNARHIHIATMPPTQQQLFVSFIKHAKHTATVSIDTDISFLNDQTNIRIIIENFENCDLVFANRREYEKLRPMITSAKEAVIKLDSDGAYYMKDGTVLSQLQAEATNAVDVTGAGDIFAGTYIASRLRGDDVERSLRNAIDTATLSVKQHGIAHLFDL